MPDIIHTNVGVIHTGHFVSKKIKIPHVWHLREYQDLHYGWSYYPSKRKFLKLLSDVNNFPIAITKGIFDHHKLELNQNSRVIYDGVFSEKVVPEIKSKKLNYFLFVGSVLKSKGIEDAINAYIQIHKELGNVEFWIVGDGNIEYVESLRNKVEKFKLSNKIKFLGYQKEVFEIMSDALALIVPSEYEGFGFITAEAMYNGCIVIGKNTAGTKEQFDNGKSHTGSEIGMRYDKNEELSNLMRIIYENGISNFKNTVLAAQKTVLQYYSIEQYTATLLNLYNQIIENGKKI
jgi:glycosyltransferase involved in cell wall biosynthesis